MKKYSDVSDHIMSSRCFNTCAKWKLSLTVTANKTSSGIVLYGNAYFFKHQNQSSILNNFRLHDEISEINRNTLKGLEDKMNLESNNMSDDSLDFNSIRFPLDNSGPHSHLIDKNLNLSENLLNILFFDFDINSNSISREQLKCFREINNDFVDKSFHFSLNGMCHGQPVFKHDIRFTLEARKFIKSMQFRLDSYKTSFMKKQKEFQRSNPNFEMKNSKNNFYSKIFTNENIGIEFYKPNLDNIEQYQTNFNSIVKSNITITNLYFELSIPIEILNKGKINEWKRNSECEGLVRSFSNFTNIAMIDPLVLDRSKSSSFYSKSIHSKQENNWKREGKHKQNGYEKSLNDIKSDYILLRQSSQGINQTDYNKSNTVNHRSLCLQMHLNQCEGMCNFIIFANSCTPYVHKTQSHMVDDIKLSKFFENFEKVSAKGLDVYYISEKETCQTIYTPTLSSMVLNVDDLQIYDNLVNEIMSNQKEYNHINFTNENNFEYVINENLKFVLKGKKILIDFSETKLPHSRLIMSEELKVIFSSFKAFELIDLSKIEKSSWFCLLWTPIKSSKLSFSSTSFLAYYQFGYTDNEVLCRGYNDYVEIPIIGLLPIKFDEKTWLKKITRNSSYYFNDHLDFKMAFTDSVNNVHEVIFSQNNKTSFDYEFYLRCNSSRNNNIV